MYKRFFIAVLCCAAMFALNDLVAQYYLLPPVQNGKNPGNLNRDNENPQGSGLSAGWQTILQGPQASGNWTATFQLPFKFYFYGQLVRSFKASTSGVVTFNTRTSMRVDSNNIALPTSRIPDTSICVWGLRAAQGDFIIAKVFGTAPHRQYWISYNSFSEQNLQSGGHVYISVVLEETTNKIFLVDQRVVCLQNNVACGGKTNLTLGIQLDSTNAMMVPGSPDYACNNNNLANTDDNVYHTFIPGQMPMLDAEGQSLSLRKFYLTREFPLSISGQFKNIGSTPINKVVFEYQINNDPVRSAEITGLNVPALGEFNLSHPIPWMLNNNGYSNHNIKAWIATINDMIPVQPADDTISTSLVTSDTVYERILLHENFSSSTSTQAKAANDTLHQILNDFPGIHAALLYPLGSPQGGDPYTTIETSSRARQYNISNFNIPRLVIDGNTLINASTYSRSMFQSLQEDASFYLVSPTGKVKGQDIEINVLVKNVAPIKTNTRLHIVVAEKQTNQNVKNNGETVFRHVVKKMLPDTLGIQLDTLPADSFFTAKISWTVPGAYRLPVDGRTTNIINLQTEHSIEEFNDLEVVCWLQEPNLEVLQAGSSNLEFSVANEELSGGNTIQVYPNPAGSYFYLDINSISTKEPVELSIIDPEGQMIFFESGLLTSKFIQTAHWKPGIYYLRLAGKQLLVSKMIQLIR